MSKGVTLFARMPFSQVVYFFSELPFVSSSIAIGHPGPVCRLCLIVQVVSISEWGYIAMNE